MQFHKLIMMTTWTPTERDTVQYRLVLHQEKSGFFSFNRENANGDGYSTFSSLELAKVMKWLIKEYNEEKKHYKNLEMIIPE